MPKEENFVCTESENNPAQREPMIARENGDETMSKEEREALLIFMRMTFCSLYPNFSLANYKEMETDYENCGEESEEFSRYPESERQSFFAKRAIYVFEDQLDKV